MLSQTNSIEALIIIFRYPATCHSLPHSPVSSSRCWGPRWWGASGRAGGCSPGSSSRAPAPSCSARDCSPRCSLKWERKGQRKVLCNSWQESKTRYQIFNNNKRWNPNHHLRLLSDWIDMKSILIWDIGYFQQTEDTDRSALKKSQYIQNNCSHIKG